MGNNGNASHPDVEERLRAVRELAQRRTREAVSSLKQALFDPAPDVRAEAALALGELKHRGSVPPLTDRLKHDSSARVRLMCAAALSWIGTPAACRGLVEALHDTDRKVAEWACVALGRTGNRRWIPFLRRVLQHACWRVRLRACEALILLGVTDGELLSALEDLASAPEAQEYANDLAIIKTMAYSEEPASQDIVGTLTVQELAEFVKQQRGGNKQQPV